MSDQPNPTSTPVEPTFSDPVKPDATSGATVDFNASSPSPAVSTPSGPGPAAAPATPFSVSIDEKAYAQYQALARTVLDSADVASRAAEAALAGGHDLKQATLQFKELTDQGHKKARLLLFITAGFMLICLIFFLIVGVRMINRVHQLDIAVATAAERVAEMQVGLQTLDKLNAGLGELTQRQTDLTKSQAGIESRIDAALKQTEAMTQKVPAETAKQVATKSDTMIRQVQSVGSGLQAQSKAVQELSKEVQSLKSGLGQVDALKRDVEALVTLQRERYLEVLQKNQAAARNNSERLVQFPRPAAQGPATPP